MFFLPCVEFTLVFYSCLDSNMPFEQYPPSTMYSHSPDLNTWACFQQTQSSLQVLFIKGQNASGSPLFIWLACLVASSLFIIHPLFRLLLNYNHFNATFYTLEPDLIIIFKCKFNRFFIFNFFFLEIFAFTIFIYIST